MTAKSFQLEAVDLELLLELKTLLSAQPYLGTLLQVAQTLMATPTIFVLDALMEFQQEVMMVQMLFAEV